MHQLNVTVPLGDGLVQPAVNRQRLVANDLKTPEHVSQYAIKRDLQVKHVAKSGVIQFPRLDDMPILVLNTPFAQGNAILLIIQNQMAAASSVREAFRIVYTMFQSMAPDLTFQPNRKDLRCRGYYTRDFDTCTFEAQI